MKAKDLIDVGSITADLLNPHLRRRFMGGGGTTINNETEETTTLPITICRLATTANILLDGSVTTVDGVSINDGDNVLVCEQTTLSANGIYFAYATGWVRYTDIKPAMLVAVSEGTANGDTVWMLTSNNFVIGADDIVFQKVLPVDGLPAGTGGKMIVNEGGDWLAKGNIALQENADNNQYIYYAPDSVNQQVRLNVSKSPGAGLYLYINGYGNYPNISIDTSSTTTRIALFGSSSQSLYLYGKGSINVIVSTYDNIQTFKVNREGVILSNSLTANTYLGANANKEIVSIPSPNLIKYQTANITSNTDVWTNVPPLSFMVEANVPYELTIKLAMGNASSRNGTIILFSNAATYIFRPFISGAFNYLAGTNIIYQPNEEELHPIVMDNETQFDFQINSNNATMELKGIFISTNNIANCILQMKTLDVGNDFIIKSYSYMKISR